MILCFILFICVSAFFTVLVKAGYKDKKFALSTGILMGSLVSGVASMVLAPAFIGLWTILIPLSGIGFVWCCPAPGFKKISKWIITLGCILFIGIGVLMFLMEVVVTSW